MTTRLATILVLITSGCGPVDLPERGKGARGKADSDIKKALAQLKTVAKEELTWTTKHRGLAERDLWQILRVEVDEKWPKGYAVSVFPVRSSGGGGGGFVIKRVFGGESEVESLLEDLDCDFWHRTTYGGEADPANPISGTVVAGPSGEDPCRGRSSRHGDGARLDRHFLGAFEGPGVLAVAVRPSYPDFSDKEFTYHVEITEVPEIAAETKAYTFVAYKHTASPTESKRGEISGWRAVRPWDFDVNRRQIRVYTEKAQTIEREPEAYSDDPRKTDLVVQGPTPLYRRGISTESVVAIAPEGTTLRVVSRSILDKERYYQVKLLDEDSPRLD